MWIETHTMIAPGLQPEQVWKVWSDINNRPQWDLDTEWAELKGPFEKGARFYFKPKGGKKLSMTITECIPNQGFTDCFKFPGARLFGIHSMEVINEDLKISTSIKVEGILGWFLWTFVGKKVAAELPEQTAMLIKIASQVT
jgi:hypothetical protein